MNNGRIVFVPPFTVSGPWLLDGNGYIVAQFQGVEFMFNGEDKLPAAEVIALALNKHYCVEQRRNTMLKLIHPNARGTGSCLTVELFESIQPYEGTVVGLDISKQIPHTGRFDTENGITAMLNFSHLCKVLEVLRGYTENIDGGIVIDYKAVKIGFTMRHVIEPTPGFEITIFRFGEEKNKSRFVLTSGEALGLCLAIEGVMSRVAFER